MVIFGWTRRATILGIKVDQCGACDHLGPHVLVRKTWWFTLFFLPVLFLRFQHGMVCDACGAWTGIPFLDVRRAMRTGALPMTGRTRRGATEARDAIFEETGRRPSEAEIFDHLTLNPKRGPWDGYLKVWPILVAACIALGIAFPRQSAAVLGDPQAKYGAAHECWRDTAGTITGCRLADGTVAGPATGTPITCYFDEPLPEADIMIRCRAR